jgi:hypothetical protein
MAQPKGLVDDFGILMECQKILPDERHRLQLLQSIAELESNEAHATRSFPKTRLHKITGIKEAIYRADIDKISGWRLHVQYSRLDQRLHLKDVVAGQQHDNVIKVIKSKQGRYEK